MLVYIMRHGVAARRDDPDYPVDADRPLTGQGRKKTRGAARGMRNLGIDINVIYTSPLPRARQTADIVAQELSHGLPIPVVETRALEPGASPADLFRVIGEMDAASAVLLVGHEPDLSRLVSTLVAGDAGAIEVPLRKASLVLVEVTTMPPAERGTLHFLLQPSHLRAIGKGK